MPTVTVSSASEWFYLAKILVSFYRHNGAKAIRVELITGHLLAIIPL